MRSGITIELDSGETVFYTCPVQVCKGKHWDQAFSLKHAATFGWAFTRNPHWSPEGEMVGVCPTCWKESKKRVVERGVPCKF